MRVSVIVTNFNYGKFLGQCLDSIRSQTFKDYEIIVVDDGSTEPDTRLYLETAHSYGALIVRHATNLGVPISNRDGIAVSIGEYIVLANADDCLEPTYLEECVKTLDENPTSAIAYTDFHHFGKVENDVHFQNWDKDQLLQWNFILGSAMFRRVAYNQVGGFSLRMKCGMEDYELWVKMALKGWSGTHIPKVLYNYRAHDTNRTNDQVHIPSCALQLWETNNMTWRIRQEREKAGEVPIDPPPNDIISVVMPITNRLPLLRKSLPSLLRQKYPKEMWELVVVDRNSNDGIEEYLRSFEGDLHCSYIKVTTDTSFIPVFKPLSGEVCNPALAWNIGVRRSHGSKIMLTSPEVYHFTNTLELGAKYCSGKKIVLADVWDAVNPYIDLSYIEKNPGLSPLVSSTYRPDDAGLYFLGVVTREFFDLIGGIDEEYMRGLSYEDTETGRRMMMSAGELIHASDMVGIHQWHERVDMWSEFVEVNRKRFFGSYTIPANRDHLWGDPKNILWEWNF